MNRILICTFFLFFVIVATDAQTRYIQKTDGTVIDTTAYNLLKEKQTSNLKNLYPDKEMVVFISDNFKELRRTKDSTVLSYKWDMRVLPAEKANNKFKVEDYIGKELPMSPLETIDGKPIKIENLKGKPTLINFWFTSCVPCVEEMPALNKIKKQFEGKVNFIAVNFQSKAQVQEFLQKRKFEFDHVANASDYASLLNIKTYPTNIFLDKEGRVVKVTNGVAYIQNEQGKMVAGDGKEFVEILEQLLR